MAIALILRGAIIFCLSYFFQRQERRGNALLRASVLPQARMQRLYSCFNFSLFLWSFYLWYRQLRWLNFCGFEHDLLALFLRLGGGDRVL